MRGENPENGKPTARSILVGILISGIVLSIAYYYAWGRHVYKITAYCDCPICINISSYRDGNFASGKAVHWGGAAAKNLPFGTQIQLVPFWPQDWWAVLTLLRARRDFVIEDRGGKLSGRQIDLFIPQRLGGHKIARKWGVRKMRILINGKLAS